MDIEYGGIGIFQHTLGLRAEMESLQNHFGCMFEAHGDEKWSIDLVIVVTQLLYAETGEHKYSANASGETGTNIGHTITNEDCITHIQTQFVASTQQQTWTWLTTWAMLILVVRAIVDLFYAPTHLCNTGEHTTMNVFNRFKGNAATCYPRLIGTDNNPMSGLCQLCNCLACARQEAVLAPTLYVVCPVLINY